MRHGTLFLLMVLTSVACSPASEEPIGGAASAGGEGSDSGSDSGEAAEAAQATPLGAGESTGELTAASPQLASGARYALYRLELDGSRRVRLLMRSSALDPALEVRGPGGFRAANDDLVPGTLDAMIDFLPEVAGTYLVRATTASAGQLGSFRIERRELAPDGLGEALELGAVLEGTLGAPPGSSAGSAELAGLPGRWLWFRAEEGSILRLRLTSRAFDTIATVIGPNGQSWVNDDAHDLGPDGSERSLDSTITLAAPRSGIYQLIVTSFGQGAGPFRVRSEVRPPPRVGPSGERPESFAGPEGRGRILSLFAGITEYDGHSNLYGCADDARLLAEAFTARHLQSPSDQVLLTNGEVTREALLSGVGRLAERARPEDVVVLFYSGHGGQTPIQEGSVGELDRFDETLILRDGELRDDELRDALEPLRAGTLLVALDSCHSGGFARDLIDRPGRVGFFSSDEDVLSDTAEPRLAGGYLSWYLRRGVLGEADARPSDGVLMAGELGDYLYRGFVRDFEAMNPPMSMDPAQRLVVRRGGIPWTQVLWTYPRAADGSRMPMPDLPLTSPPPHGAAAGGERCPLPSACSTP